MSALVADVPREEGARAPAQILLVEDDVLIRILIADVIRERGFTVIECADANEALSVLNAGTPIALMISDVRMPGGIDGVGLARLVKQQYPTTKIFLASGHFRADAGLEIDGFFVKPFNLAELLSKIKAALE